MILVPVTFVQTVLVLLPFEKRQKGTIHIARFNRAGGRDFENLLTF